jgi:hypothetical protein
MSKNKILRAIIIIAAAFVLSLLFAFIDSYPTLTSAYDLGRSTAAIFKNLIKILGMLGLFWLFYKSISKKN